MSLCSQLRGTVTTDNELRQKTGSLQLTVLEVSVCDQLTPFLVVSTVERGACHAAKLPVL